MSKKLYTTQRWKDYMRARQEYELRAVVHRKRGHRHSGRLRHRHSAKRTWLGLRLPARFSILRNPEETIGFLREFRAQANKFNLQLDLSEVQEITVDAITALIAQIQEASEHARSRVRGNQPKNQAALDILEQSGFFAFLQSDKPPSQKGKISQQRSSKKVEPGIARDLIRFGTKAISGRALKCKAAYRVLIEGMNNTHNHASGIHHRKETWWSTVYADPARRRVCFAFLDTGVGIFKSVKLRGLRRIYRGLRIVDNPRILRDVLNGKVESSTGQPHRGKGLPAIYRLLCDARIENLTIVANDVYADVGNSDYRGMRPSFRGTLLYWEIKVGEESS